MIKGIIFDLGGTLIRVTRAWEEIHREGAEAMADWYVKKKRIKLDTQALVDAFLTRRAADLEQASQSNTEVLAQDTLRRALRQIEAPARAETALDAAIKIFFEPEEAASRPFADAVDTVKTLHAQGYRLGLYSNATDDPLIQRLVNRNKFRPWLSPTFSSAGCGWRKPKPDGFLLIAQRWALAPHEIVVVGDTLKADILGAHHANMGSILVTMDEASSNNEHRHIQPTAAADSLAALPEIIRQL